MLPETASWSPSCFSKISGGLEFPIARNFSVNYPPPSPLAGAQAVWPWAQSPPGTPSATSAVSASAAWFASSIGPASFPFNSLMLQRSWLACSFMGSLHLGLASFLCCARTPTSHPQLRSCTALLLPALPKDHSDAEVGPLNLSQSLVIMLAMLNFFLLFVQQYIIIICSHPRPLQHTSPHLTNMSQLQTPIVQVD